MVVLLGINLLVMSGIEAPHIDGALIWDIDDIHTDPQHPTDKEEVTTGVRSVTTVRPGAGPVGVNDNTTAYGHGNSDVGGEGTSRPTIPFSIPRDEHKSTIGPSEQSPSRRSPSKRAPITPGQMARSAIKSIIPPPPRGLLPISDATPVRGIHTDHLYMATSPSFRRSLRGPTVEIAPTDELVRRSLPSDRPPADTGTDPDWKDLIDETDPIVNLSEHPEAFVDITDIEDDWGKTLLSPNEKPANTFDLAGLAASQPKGNAGYSKTMLPPPPPLENLDGESHRNTVPGVGPALGKTHHLMSIEGTNRNQADKLNSIVIDDITLQAQAAEATARYMSDERKEETGWFDSLKSSIKTAATKISEVVRSSIASIFSFRRTMRQSFAAILLAAGLNAIASSQGTPVQQAHTDEPTPVNVQVAPSYATTAVDGDIAPTVAQAETPVALSTFSKTITVTSGLSPHVTFVQALTEFLTNNGTRAALPAGYQHRHGDAIRILHQLERGPQHETANHLRHLTHTGDRFSFSVMSDGSISLDNWQNRHTNNSKLPRPITFDLPAHL